MKIATYLKRYDDWLFGLFTVAFTIVGTLILLPYVIGYGIVASLEDEAGTRTATIEDVDYNPFTGDLAIMGLSLTAPGNRGATLNYLHLELENRALWRKRIYLHELTVDGAVLDIDLDGQLRLGGIPITPGPETADTGDDDESGWDIGLDKLTIADSHIAFHADGKTETVDIRAGGGSPFLMWAAETPGDIDTQMDLSGGTLRIKGTLRPFDSAPAFDLALSLDHVAIGPLLRLWPQQGIPDIDSGLTAELRLRGRFATDAPEIHIGGTLQAADFRMTLPDSGTPYTAKSVSLDDIDTTVTLDGTTRLVLNTALKAADLKLPIPGGDRPGAASALTLTAKETVFNFAESGITGNGRISFSIDGLNTPAGPYSVNRGGLGWDGTVDVTLNDTATVIATEGALSLSKFALAGLEIALDGDSARYEGKVTFTGPPESGTLLETNGTLKLGNAAFRQGPDGSATTIRMAAATINAKAVRAAITPDGALDLTVDSDGTIDGTDIEAGTMRLTQGGMAWNAKNETAVTADGKTTVKTTGRIDSTKAVVTLPNGGGTGDTNVSWDRITLAELVSQADIESGNIELSMDSQTEAHGLGASQGDASFENALLRWNGNIHAAIPNDAAMTVDGKGRLDSSALTLNTGVSGIGLEQDSAVWNGEFYLSLPSEGQPTLTKMQARAEMGAVRVDSNELGLRLLEIAGVRLEDISGGGDKFTAKHLVVDDIVFLRPQESGSNGSAPKTAEESNVPPKGPTVVTLGQFQLETITADLDGRIEAASMTLDRANIQIERGKDGSLALVSSLLPLLGQQDDTDAPAAPTETSESTATPAAPPVSETDTASGPPAFTFRIGETVVTGDSRLVFTDRSVAPAVSMTLEPVAVTLSAIDSAAPDQPTALTLTSTLDKYTSLALNGDMKPFTQRLNANLAGNLKGFDLTAISGYTAEFLGYDFKRGRLDADIDAKITDGQLATDSTLTITKLDVAPTDPEALNPLRNRIEVPLETALSLLRDGNDVIKLNVPVGGDIASPQFDFSDAINQAIGGAIKNTMTTLLKVAFPIGGAIKIIVDQAGGKRLQIDPVIFAAGDASLSADANEHLNLIEKLLIERPAVKLTVCAHATPADREALLAELQRSADAKPAPKPAPDKAQDEKPEIKVADSVMLDLARRRGEAVKDTLIARDGIDEARLFLCAPNLSNGEESPPPSVDLRF